MNQAGGKWGCVSFIYGQIQDCDRVSADVVSGYESCHAANHTNHSSLRVEVDIFDLSGEYFFKPFQKSDSQKKKGDTE